MAVVILLLCLRITIWLASQAIYDGHYDHRSLSAQTVNYLIGTKIIYYEYFSFSITIPTRGKSLKEDYCYMAEHDLPPLKLYSRDSVPQNEEGVVNVDTIAEDMPVLPSQKRKNLIQKYSKQTILSIIKTLVFHTLLQCIYSLQLVGEIMFSAS